MFLRSRNGGRSFRVSWRMSGRKLWGGLKVIFFMRFRNLSFFQFGQIVWFGNMFRSVSSSSEKQRDFVDFYGLRVLVRVGDSRRRSSGFLESEFGLRRKNCVRVELGGCRRFQGIENLSQLGLGLGQSILEEWGGVVFGDLVMCFGFVLGEGIQRLWLQFWWLGVFFWRNRGF